MQERKQPISTREPISPIHPDTFVGTVTLKTADLGLLIHFYTEVIGLELLHRSLEDAVLGAGSRPIIKLVSLPEAKQPPTSATGLYHAAILFPDRRSLAIKIAQITAQRIPLGEADHLVSEAFYLSDPEGNGLELYRDRPREEWKWGNGSVVMATDPIDWTSFLGEIRRDDPDLSNPLAPKETKLGHVHLKVADIDDSLRFYHGVLGFDVMARIPGALFVSAGGYHHHIGMNTWQSRGGVPPTEPSTGLLEYSIILPDHAELDRVTNRIEAAGITIRRDNKAAYVQDPSQIPINLSLPDNI